MLTVRETTLQMGTLREVRETTLQMGTLREVRETTLQMGTRRGWRGEGQASQVEEPACTRPRLEERGNSPAAGTGGVETAGRLSGPWTKFMQSVGSC